jgi:hypothetical protein
LFPTLLTSALTATVAMALDPPPVAVTRGLEMRWVSTPGRLYQPQHWNGTAWMPLASPLLGNGESQAVAMATGRRLTEHRVLETTAATPVFSNLLTNPGFESGTGATAGRWSTTGAIHARTTDESESGSFSHAVRIENIGALPDSGLLWQTVPVSASTSYTVSFAAKQGARSPTYVQFFQVEWLDAEGVVLSSTGNRTFDGGAGSTGLPVCYRRRRW